MRLMTKPDARPPAAPPVVKSELESTDRLVVIDGSTWREGVPAEPRGAVGDDSLPPALHAVAGESTEKTESTVARGSAGTSPTRRVDRQMETDDDDEATDELFRQIQEMTNKFNALVAPPVPEDVAAFRRLLEQARVRLPPAPPVTAGEMPLRGGGIEQ